MSEKPLISVDRNKRILNEHSAEAAAKTLLEQTGLALRRPGFKHLGDWSIHVFQSEFTHQIEIMILQNLPQHLDKDGNYVGVTEQIAILSLEEARKSLMDTFGKGRK